MRKLLVLLILSFMATHCKMMQPETDTNARVSTKSGILEGIYAPDKNLNIFYGIPYAKPPVGDLRWKAPQPITAWKGSRSAKTFGNRPMQVRLWDDLIYRSEKMSEDCLYLNVWAPAQAKETPLPVLFYIHGGGFNAGDGSELRYDGARMAQQGMVVVTINYRLNIFGFLALPELTAEADYNASGNYGLLDQAFALSWVRENISSFGGDPSKITIAGESAGSISVSSLMASPLSKDLIASAIGESGAAIEPTLAPVSLDEAEQNGSAFAKAINAPSLAELRSLSADSLFSLYVKQEYTRFPTVIDGYFYPASLPELYEAGEQAKIPLLLGWNSAEMPAEAFMAGDAFTAANFKARVESAFPEVVDEVLKLYPHSTSVETRQAATDLASDRFIVFSSWKWFDLQRKHSPKPVYRYLYSKLRPQNPLDTLAPTPLGAGHAHEIEYALGNLHYIKAHNWTAEDYEVSRTMQSYFANFIKTGNPNGRTLPEWRAAAPEQLNPRVMNINTTSNAEAAKHEERYRFWDQYYIKE